MNVAQEFDPLYRAALALNLEHSHDGAALATITQTRGSTFRRAGASMLVLRDGRLICELSGGCPQRDIAWRAQQVIDSGQPALVAYGREANYDVMIETGCGGELEVLIEPLQVPRDLQFLDAIAQLRSRRLPGAMATVYAADGDVLGPRPQRLVQGEGVTWSDIEVDALRQQIAAALPTIDASMPKAATRRMSVDGRSYEVLVESLLPPHALVIVGDGVSARVLAELSVQLGWQTTLVDPAQTTTETSNGIRHIAASPQALATQVVLDHLTSAVVMTHRLERDLGYLEALLDTPVSYLGVIGSRQRAAQIQGALPHGHPRLHMPAGLDVGSETPQEIALAVAAEILATRNGRSGGPLTHSQMPIHP
ncbi:Xanthine and CO dehydrogenase maturation factor, XdhC/CoxF family [Dyella sp. OK004]|uniref:XdhC family protein n=1 Tax=Dyella sp. OK004 TaxID=1855292 RepID=UPI0008EFA0BE|nr:XdhC family protein [Dyella sp. OK004]SFS14054.1 Xanthine and CO dehydrogenase maturation factor, XdhC/CoxF family [Dyella sp. OK004]